MNTILNLGEHIDVGIRPEKIKLADPKRKTDENIVRVMVTNIELLGPRAIVKMEHESGQVLTSVVDHDEIGKYELGTNIGISLASNDLHIFPKIKD